MHVPTTGDNLSTAPCDVVDLTCEELGAVSPTVTGTVYNNTTCHKIQLYGGQ